MVDALLESWRVLVADGIMIDLRPYHTNPALEIITANGTFVPGYIDDSGSVADDIASDNAIAEMVRQGRFARVSHDSFRFANYWDTLDGLLAYADERWRDFACIPPFVVEAARLCVASAGSHYQVRVPRAIHIAVYKKQI
ncbi:MAG: hypothetical protein ACK2U5_23355 [Candidatus Promineifilaceae bacterium]